MCEDENTPVEQYNGVWVKRDDLYRVGRASGGKARACYTLARAARTFNKGLVAFGGRASVQTAIVAFIGQELGLSVRIHAPEGEETPELWAAKAAGATIVRHRAGYTSVLQARARLDALQRNWRLIPYGLGCLESVNCISREAASLPKNVLSKIKRIVIPLGSGTNAAGVLRGTRRVPIIGVRIGADPTKHLHQLVPGWSSRLTIVPASMPYKNTLQLLWNGIDLDPIYEAKCVEFLQPGDLFWIVGRR